MFYRSGLDEIHRDVDPHVKEVDQVLDPLRQLKPALLSRTISVRKNHR
jgi:hypothetical protein